MSDARLRELERRWALGDPEAAAQAVALGLRTGAYTPAEYTPDRRRPWSPRANQILRATWAVASAPLPGYLGALRPWLEGWRDFNIRTSDDGGGLTLYLYNARKHLDARKVNARLLAWSRYVVEAAAVAPPC